ncbi:nuclear transport factor 2 family protein [Mycobacterium sp. LTG2003]
MDVEAIAEKYNAAWNANDLEAILGLQGEDMVFQLHAAGFEPAVGAEAVRTQFAYFLDAWDGLRFEARDVRVAGELIANEYRFSATLVKPFPLQGDLIAPSSRRVEADGVDVITVRDGLVRTKHMYLDTLAMRRQLSG